MPKKTIITTKIINPTSTLLKEWISKNSQWDVCWFRKSLEWEATDDTYLFQVQKRMKDKTDILNWIKSFKPTHFISINPPLKYRQENYADSLAFLRLCMKNFERQLCGSHWIHHYIPFIGFAENHRATSSWHFHLFLNQKSYSDKDIIKALEEMCKERELGRLKIQGQENIVGLDRSAVIDVLKIDYKEFEDDLFYYASKEMGISINGTINPDRIITSGTLFNRSESKYYPVK